MERLKQQWKLVNATNLKTHEHIKCKLPGIEERTNLIGRKSK